MSLAADRAVAIWAAIRADKVARSVFLMPREHFTCRVVAVPSDGELRDWVTAHAEVYVGGFAARANGEMGYEPEAIENAIWGAMRGSTGIPWPGKSLILGTHISREDA